MFGQNKIKKFRQKFFYFPSEIAKIKEDALIDAQCEMENEWEKLEDERDALDNDIKNFEFNKNNEYLKIANMVTNITTYKNPDFKRKSVVLEYIEDWDSYVKQDVIFKHIANQLVKKMESSIPF